MEAAFDEGSRCRRTTRGRKQMKALNRSNEIYQDGVAGDYDEVKKLHESIVYRREDLTTMIIQYIFRNQANELVQI